MVRTHQRAYRWPIPFRGDRPEPQSGFPVFMRPPFFRAGVFNPIRVLPWYLAILCKRSPMHNAVD
jgi:hypothetical protein